jgi:hypothetical protein
VIHSHFEMIASPQFELTRSPHYEYNPGVHEVYPIVAGTYQILADADWYLTSTWYAKAAAGGERQFVVEYDRYGSIINDTITGTPGIPGDDVNVAALFGRGNAVSNTEWLYLNSQGPDFDYATIMLSGPTFGLADLRVNCLQLLNSTDFRLTAPDTYIQVNYVINRGGGGVPTLYSPETGVYVWGLGGGGTVNGVAPPPSPTPTTIIKTFGNAPNQAAEAQSFYGSGNWHMQKSYVVHPGFTKFYWFDTFIYNPGPPPSPDSGFLAGNGAWLLTPIGTTVDTPPDTSQDSAAGDRFFDHLA